MNDVETRLSLWGFLKTMLKHHGIDSPEFESALRYVARRWPTTENLH